ncbi:MAG TPA: hypothetical protein VFZ99_00160 [Terriglobales bacterium]
MSRPRIRAGNSTTKVAMYSVQGHYIRNISYREALKLVESGQARLASKRDAPGRPVDHVSRIQLKQFVTKPNLSPATITVSEILANAGLFGPSRTQGATEDMRKTRSAAGRQPEDFIERAATKVALWPLIGDTKAVRACRAQEAQE